MKLKPYLLPLTFMSLFVIPVSTNFDLREFNLGNGGGGVQRSTNFGIESVLGEQGAPASGTTYKGGLGFGFTQMANVPPTPTITNPANYYNMLHIVLNNGNNPSDTKFAIAISNDGFSTTNYVKADTTVTPSLTLSDYQTYSTWGGGSGFDVIGLAPSTTYTIKVKAMQGNFTESGYGPTSSASTVNPSLDFDIDVAATDTETSAPYATNLGNLTAGSVVSGSDKIWVDLDTNAASGAKAYISGLEGGLRSVSKSYTISSITGDLASSGQGFGLQALTATQSGGATLTMESPYDGSSDVVGPSDAFIRNLFSASGPIVSGRGSVAILAKSSSLTPSASDYQEVLTVIASASF